MQSDYTAGFVKLPRFLLTEGGFRNLKEFGLFVRLVLKAAHKPTTVTYRNKVWNLKTGQLVITHRDMKKLGFGDTEKRTVLRNFEEAGKINTKSNKAGTVITICNYAEIYGNAALGHASGQSKHQAAQCVDIVELLRARKIDPQPVLQFFQR